MTKAELLLMPSNAPVKMADGSFGLLIRWYKDGAVAGIQVPGEPNIREVPCERLCELGNGALIEADHPR